MTTILTINYTSYALPGNFTDADVVKLLTLTRGMRPVDTKHSDDYKVSRLVFKGSQERVALSLEPECPLERDEWEAVRYRAWEAAHQATETTEAKMIKTPLDANAKT